MKNSNIEWCDHTFNAWEGCTKVSPGCANCYAEARNQRFAAGANWGPGAPRRRTSVHNWNEPMRWNRDAAASGQRPRVFCASLADWLDSEVPIEWLADLLMLIHDTPNLDWLLLTKRPENWSSSVEGVFHFASQQIVGNTHEDRLSLMQWLTDWMAGSAPANVWIGVSVEDFTRAVERHHLLMKIPARVHFWSAEPMLSEIHASELWVTYGKPDWVICGGESGKDARPMHPDWARSLRDQCTAAGVAFFFKQWGEWGPTNELWKGSVLLAPNGKRYPNDDTDPQIKIDYPYRDHRALLCPMTPKGKKDAGRLLDGREWNELPTS